MAKQLQEPLYVVGEINIHDTYAPDARVVLFEGETTQLLAQMPDASVDLVITSPPLQYRQEL